MNPRLKWALTNPTDKVTLSEEMGRVDLEDVEAGTGRLVTDEGTRRQRVGDGVRFAPGDVLFGKLRPYLRKSLLCTEVGTCSPELLVLQPKPEALDSRYLHYLVLSDHFARWAVAHSWGAKMPRTDFDSLRQFRVALPPVEEQERLADLLDQECGRIDTLLAAKRRFADLLREKSDALRTDFALRGMDPDAATADSGMPTIGNIPAHWLVLQNKTVFREVADLSTSGTEELLTVSHITGVTPRAEKDVNMFMAASLVGYKRCQPGDLVVNTMWAWMGALGVAKQEGIVSPAYGVYRPSQERLVPQYCELLCRTPGYVAEMTRYSKGIWSSRLRLYPEAFLSLKTLLPPMYEQRAIAEDHAAAQAPIAELLAKLDHSMDLLKERRQALVTATIMRDLEPATPAMNEPQVHVA